MKGSRFSEEQIIGCCGNEAGAKTEEVCRRYGISSATLYKWKSKYGGLEAADFIFRLLWQVGKLTQHSANCPRWCGPPSADDVGPGADASCKPGSNGSARLLAEPTLDNST